MQSTYSLVITRYTVKYNQNMFQLFDNISHVTSQRYDQLSSDFVKLRFSITAQNINNNQEYYNHVLMK